MASRRILKKAINAVCFDIIDECLTLREFGQATEDQVVPILNDAISLRNDLIQKLNQGAKGKEGRVAARQVRTELEEKILSFIDRLNEIQG